MRDHNKLKAFQLADELVIAVYELTASWPGREQFGLTMQIRRAAVSAASNIVEGCARHSEADYLHFLDIAYGSVCEVGYQLSVGRRLEFAYHEKAHVLAHETAKVLNGLIRSLRHTG
jgi:four helix bundle protein